MSALLQEKPTHWTPDEASNVCQSCCAVEFNSIQRKHHCRACGKVICNSCSKNKLLIPLENSVTPPRSSIKNILTFDPREPQRCCQNCAEILIPRQAQLRSDIAHCSYSLESDRNTFKRYFNNPLKSSLRDEILKATNTLLNFTEDNKLEGEDKLPRELIRSAKGLAFITLLRAGFLFTGRIGTGLVVARTPDGNWSAPSAIACGGLGWGFQAGGDVTDFVIILNSQSAVEAFSGRGSISIGTQLSLSVGLVGRAASTDVRAGDAGMTSAFSYAHSKGLFAGASFEAGTIFSRFETNRAFYGIAVTPKELLLGGHPRPIAAHGLYNAIREVEVFENKTANPSEADDQCNCINPIENDVLLDGSSRGGIGKKGIISTIKGKLQNVWARGIYSIEPAAKLNEDWVQQRRKRVLAMREQNESLLSSEVTEMMQIKGQVLGPESNSCCERDEEEKSECSLEVWEHIDSKDEYITFT